MKKKMARQETMGDFFPEERREEFVTEPVLGIDLGTTNSLAGLVDTGFPVLIPDGNGQRVVPSFLHFTGGSGEPLVGREAKRARRLRPEATVYSVKSFMGRRFAELTETDREVPYPTEADSQGGVKIVVGGRDWTPEELSACILKKLKAMAEDYLGRAVTRAVITVPAYFNDAQRNATKKAGELAGLEVMRILNEPTAAALAYGFDRNKRKGRCAVYDLGGGTFDISILELNEGVFQVLSTQGNTRLGGDDIDLALARDLSRRLQEAMGEEAAKGQWNLLVERAEEIKCRLSEEESVEVEFPFVDGQQSFHTLVTRETLESLAKPLVEGTRQNCRRALSDAGIKAEDVDEVLLVGGQTRMPLVRALVEEIFGRKPNTEVNPDEAVALGATVQAGILEGSLGSVVLLDVTPLSLGIETFGGLMNVIIPRNSTIPVKAGEQFTTAVDGQRLMKIRVLQGERELAKDNWTLGDLTIGFPSAARGVPRVGVQFEIDADGILKVLVRDIQTGRDETLAIETAVDVSDEAVEKMVSESVEHALEDMEARQFIEAELSAKRTLAMTRKAVEMLGSDLNADEQSRVEGLVRAVEEAMAGGQGRKVKAKLKELDEGSKFVAERLMEKMVNQALDKR